MSINFESILITGGTGSFGKALLKKLLKEYRNYQRIIIFSRDELKQWELQNQFPLDKYPQIRFFLGDVRDKDRLKMALENVDIVVHAAALKQVPAAEYNPIEFIKTNILGAQNLVEASLERGVKKIIALSTDKAVAPINLYGATKLCSDKLFIAANNLTGYKDIAFSLVRYGNVMGSRGSVIPFFLEKAKSGVLPITSPEMTRFNISLNQSVEMVLNSISKAIGGEILVPKIPSYRILDLATSIGPNCKKDFIGIRPGEKINEEMITSSDSFYTIDIGDYFSILPQSGELHRKYEESGIEFQPVEQGFSYNSGDNTHFLEVNELRELIRLNIDQNFKPY